MDRYDEQCMRLGKDIVRIIKDLAALPPGKRYAKRPITFPGGKVCLIVTPDEDIVSIMEKAVAERLDVADSIPKSEIN